MNSLNTIINVNSRKKKGGGVGSGFIPTSITGCVLWFDANDSSTITQTASKVSQWNDKSGNGYSVIQPTATNQPTYTTNLLNGKPGIALSTTAWLYQLGSNMANFTSPAATSVFIVARNDNPLSNWGIINTVWFSSSNPGSNGITRYHFSFANGSAQGVYLFANGSAVGASSAVAAGVNAVICFSVSSTSKIIAVNGTSSTFAGASLISANNTNTNFQIGDARQTASYINNPVIYELVGFNSQLTTANQQKVEGYLAWKWGLQTNLPTNHLYYSAAP